MEFSREDRIAWYESLPSFYAAACLLITDRDENVLLVKPNYRDHWTIPGGIIEATEAPHECVAREVREELGIEYSVGQLLVVDWVAPEGLRPRAIMNFMFDGGTVQRDTQIRLPADELEAYAFIDSANAKDYLPENIAPRIHAGLAARRAQQTIYLPRVFGSVI